MGCFLACFISSSSSKRRLKHHSSPESLSEEQVIQTSGVIQLDEQAKREESVAIDTIRESSQDEFEDEANCDTKKKVTFDLNVKSYEESFAKKEATCDLVENNEDEDRSGKEEASREIEPLLGDIELSKVVSLNPSNRYQNCRKSTDEYIDTGLDASDLEVNDDSDDYSKPSLVQEESSESLFSLSIDSRKHLCDTEKGEKEVNSPMPIQSSAKDQVKVIEPCRDLAKRCRFGDTVLNPIENLTQWNEVKQKPTQQNVQHQDKENLGFKPCLGPENHGSKPKLSETKHAQQEIGVDTSLSSWLVGCEGVSKSSCGDCLVANSDSSVANSPRRPENGQILGDLGVDVSSSSTRSGSQSPDPKTPMIGTVWSYWVRTGQNIDSDSGSSSEGIPITPRENREDRKMHCDSDSLEGRLDKALDKSVC